MPRTAAKFTPQGGEKKGGGISLSSANDDGKGAEETVRGLSKYSRALAKHQVGLIKRTRKRSSKMTIIVTGDQGASKTCGAATIPRPYGGRFIFISFDETTYDSLAGLYGEDWLEENRIEVYEVYKPQYAYEEVGPGDTGKDGNPEGVPYDELPEEVRDDEDLGLEPGKRYRVVETYPGFDPTRSWTSEVVIGEVFGLLERFETETQEPGMHIDNIYLDHFQYAEDDVGKGFAYHRANAEWGERIEWNFWDFRADFIKKLWKKARSIARHVTLLSGYSDEAVWEDEPYVNAQGEEKVKKVKTWKDPRWMERVRRDVFYHIHCESREDAPDGPDDDPRVHFYATTKRSKNPRLFPTGVRLEITRTPDKAGGLGVFWEREKALSKEADLIPDPSDDTAR